MKLYAHCPSCRSEIRIQSKASTRPDLQMEKGNEFSLRCQNCGNDETIHVNDIKAEKNNMVIFIGLGLGVIVTIVLLIKFGLIGSAGMAIPFLFWQQQMNATKSFNSYTIRRR